ncbi:DUF6518 family protein [Herbiconiux ginsengi]|uniref:DUF6518 family protein n=1 Tax=Herbiconiux ginsengi TaxID=381665 RepID=UPI00389905BB
MLEANPGDVTPEQDALGDRLATSDPVGEMSSNVGLLRRAVVVLVLSLLIGCAESWAQGLLPDLLRPLSNSPRVPTTPSS